jgi:hypothetical protein
VNAAPKKRPANGKDKAVDKKSESGKRVTLKITVLDVADGKIYVSPGSDEGLNVGDSVQFGGSDYEVIAVTASFAVLPLGNASLDVGAKGKANVELGREAPAVERMPKPPSVATYQGLWSDARRPADDQTPKPVPLGLIQDESRNRVTFSAYGYGVIANGDRGTGIGRAELRSQLHFEPFVSAPFAIDVDVSGQTWIAPNLSDRRADDARPALRVRRLEAAYGRERSFLGSIGRLRQASSFLGNLDGVKLRAPLAGGLSVSAFGGAVPEPLSGVPSATARFGGEFAFEDLEAEWRPRLILGGHASRFEGNLDERRVNASLDLLPGFGRFGAHAEVSFFDADNPWAAETTELSSVGADAAVRAGVLEFAARGGLQRPERSNWLASFLPPEWLCVSGPTAAAASACLGSDATLHGSGEVGVRLDQLSASVGANAARTQSTDSDVIGGYAHLRLIDIVGTLRVDAGASGARSTALTNVGVSLSPGLELLDRKLDLSARYRPAVTRYTAADSAFVEHLVGMAVWYSPSRHFNIALDADTVFGSDVDVLVLQGLATWRPQL